MPIVLPQDNREREISPFRSSLKISLGPSTYTGVCPESFGVLTYAYDFPAVHRYGQ